MFYSESSDQDVCESGNQAHLKITIRNQTSWKGESSDLGNILAIKLLDLGCKRINWRYGSDYPLRWEKVACCPKTISHQGHLPEVEYDKVMDCDEELWRCGELMNIRLVVRPLQLY